MNKRLLFLAAVMLLAVTGYAQQIAVVSGGTTHVYQTLKDAIDHADDGSVIYLPGGGFQIGDSVKITHRVTIVGIGHKANGENADGNTCINGNLFFNQGSGGSAIMGCYISGNVNIGEDGVVNNITIKRCNLNSVLVLNSGVTGTVVNQNYIREASYFGGCGETTISNNIMGAICDVYGGIIINNNVFGSVRGTGGYGCAFLNIHSTNVSENIFWQFTNRYGTFHGCSDITFSKNLNYGDEPITIDASWDNLFVNYNSGSISPSSDFHFKDDYKEYETQVGIYAGDGFSEGGVPPVPYIKAKRIAEQTDAAGMLKVQIRVNAGE